VSLHVTGLRRDGLSTLVLHAGNRNACQLPFGEVEGIMDQLVRPLKAEIIGEGDDSWSKYTVGTRSA